MTRLEKYRQKNSSLIMISKIALIGYLVLFVASYLTAETEAYFAGQQHVSKINISAGVWEDEESEEPVSDNEKDESALAFIENSDEDEEINTCPAEIEVEIENNGDGPMLAEGIYEIYYAEDGDPVEDGEKIELDDEAEEGIIDVLESGEAQKITYEANEPGIYTFVVYQHEDSSDDDRVLSEDIIVECESNENEQTSDQEEEENEESKGNNEPEQDEVDESESDEQEREEDRDANNEGEEDKQDSMKGDDSEDGDTEEADEETEEQGNEVD